MRAVALRTGPNAAAWGPLAPATTPSCTRARAMRQQPPPTALTATSTPRPHMTTRVHSTCVPLLPRARRVAAEGCRGTRRALPHRRVPIIAVLQLPRRPLPREAGASVDLPQPMRLQEGEPRVVRPLTQRDQRMCLVLEPCVTRRERRKLARHLLDRDGHLEARVASERDAEEVAHARRVVVGRHDHHLVNAHAGRRELLHVLSAHEHLVDGVQRRQPRPERDLRDAHLDEQVGDVRPVRRRRRVEGEGRVGAARRHHHHAPTGEDRLVVQRLDARRSRRCIRVELPGVVVGRAQLQDECPLLSQDPPRRLGSGGEDGGYGGGDPWVVHRHADHRRLRLRDPRSRIVAIHPAHAVPIVRLEARVLLLGR
mmetsp:Transcript_60855/g.181166  ORF Transcript_60855/g.181166 Transcript_60855/m.181166 type:complete len:369 (+) Transcript_60855:233-1339(+)